MPEANLFLLFTRKLNELKLDYMVSGSVAAIVYGEPRLTHDVDIIVTLGRDEVGALSRAFPLDEFYFPPEEVVVSEALRTQRGHFNIIHHDSGFKADIYVAGRDPLHRWALERARVFPIDGESIRVAPPEYVIVRKLEYFREGGSEKHLRDIESILANMPELRTSPDLLARISERGLEAVWEDVNRGMDAD